MRILGSLAAMALLGGSTAAAAAADYFLEIKSVGRDSVAGPLYLQANIGDLDGDGATDEAVIRLTCVRGNLSAAHYNVKSPRDSASGMASGKRTHHPVTFVKEWGAATPQLFQARVSWDLKQAKGLRVAADRDGWVPMTLSGTEGLCAAAETAVKATKSRSNVQNN